jgi:serine/threonine-protein kinase
MGRVWLAWDETRRTGVAVKFHTNAFDEDEAGLERFRREALLGQGLDSPHIVKVLGYGALEDGAPYIVMEYVYGVDLRAYVTRRGRLPLHDARSIIEQLCGALELLHRRGITHRDIKPSNVLVVQRPEGLGVKLADFGLAHDAKAAHLTWRDVLVGTPSYMSPERILGDRSSNPRCDLWSAAAVAYTCVTGEPPFDGELPAVCLAICHGRAQPVTKVRPDAPPELARWFSRALHHDPDRRFASAAELARTFAAACDGIDPSSTRLVARRRTAAAPLLAAFAVAASGLIAYGDMAVAPAHSRPVAETQVASEIAVLHAPSLNTRSNP